MERHQWKNGDIVRLKEDNGKNWQIYKTNNTNGEWFIAEIRDCGIAGGWVSTWTLDNEYDFVNNPIDDAQEAIKKEFDKIKKHIKESSWNEEDEKNYRMLQKIICDSGITAKMANKLSDWLKSIKERYTWKPSDEQMDALETATSSLQSTALESLYNDLEKL